MTSNTTKSTKTTTGAKDVTQEKPKEFPGKTLDLVTKPQQKERLSPKLFAAAMEDPPAKPPDPIQVMDDDGENLPPAPITIATPIKEIENDKEQPEEAIIAAMVEQDVIAVTIEQDGA